MLKYLLIALVVIFTSAKEGGDIAISTRTVDNFKCLKQHGISFVIFRGFRSYGAVDPYVILNIKNAHAAGYSDIDVYVFPCLKCGDPRGQIRKMVNALKGLPYNSIWLDVERFQWKNKEANRKFLAEMFDEAPKHGKPVGIYTNSVEWNAVVGNDWTQGARFRLWWAHWDKKATLDNFQPFAGWKQCFIKQYFSERTVCNIEYDCNFKK